MEKKYYTPQEICDGKMEGIDKGIFTIQLFRNLNGKKIITWTKIGNRVFYTRDDIESYLERNRRKLKR